jgi:putative membrane protein
MKIINSLTKSAICLVLSTGFLFFPASAQKSQKLTDPEIASVAVNANQIDIDYAKIAIKKSKDKEVINFAKTMEKDHGAVIDQAVALVTKLGVTPEDNATSQSLNAQAIKTRKVLNSKSGKAFDKAYVYNEVAYHTAVIGAVENVLIPDATNKELHDLLISAVPLFKAHLEHAKMLQKSLGK